MTKVVTADLSFIVVWVEIHRDNKYTAEDIKTQKEVEDKYKELKKSTKDGNKEWRKKTFKQFKHFVTSKFNQAHRSLQSRLTTSSSFTDVGRISTVSTGSTGSTITTYTVDTRLSAGSEGSILSISAIPSRRHAIILSQSISQFDNSINLSSETINDDNTACSTS